MIEVKINKEFCKGCGLCIDVCPKGVLALGKEMNAKGNNFVVAERSEECVGCKSCSTMCPEAAIELFRK